MLHNASQTAICSHGSSMRVPSRRASKCLSTLIEQLLEFALRTGTNTFVPLAVFALAIRFFPLKTWRLPSANASGDLRQFFTSLDHIEGWRRSEAGAGDICSL